MYCTVKREARVHFAWRESYLYIIIILLYIHLLSVDTFVGQWPDCSIWFKYNLYLNLALLFIIHVISITCHLLESFWAGSHIRHPLRLHYRGQLKVRFEGLHRDVKCREDWRSLKKNQRRGERIVLRERGGAGKVTYVLAFFRGRWRSYPVWYMQGCSGTRKSTVQVFDCHAFLNVKRPLSAFLMGFWPASIFLFSPWSRRQCRFYCF